MSSTFFDLFVDFFSFQSHNTLIATIGCVLVSIATAMIGVFSYLRKESLLGDVVSHSVLPGVVLAYIIFLSKNLLILIAGATLAGWFSIFYMNYTRNKTKLKSDTALAVTLTTFFGLGMLLMSIIQQSGSGSQSGLDDFIFGNAAAIQSSDVWLISGVFVFVMGSMVVFFKGFRLICFDKDFAISKGLGVRLIEFSLSTLTTMVIASGIQTVGAILISALLIIPAAVASFWSYRLISVVLIAGGAGAIAGLSGVFVSYASSSMPTGPWIVMILGVLMVISILFSPLKGILVKQWKVRKNKEKILMDNVLKALYKAYERASSSDKKSEPIYQTVEQIRKNRAFGKNALRKGLYQLVRKDWVIRKSNHGYALSEMGYQQARAIVRRHRLWELYLTKKMNLKADHVHPNAEAMEHIITPEIEEELLKELGSPSHDPHSQEIPYKN